MSDDDFEEIPETTRSEHQFAGAAMSAGGVTIRNDDDGTDPGMDVWRARDEEYGRSLDSLFRIYLKDMNMRADALSAESNHRMRRYKWTRASIISLLLISIAVMTYSSGFSSEDYIAIAAKSTPAIVIFASLLYVIEAFLRDYEVGIETAVAAEKLIRQLRKYQFEWTVAHDQPDKRQEVLRSMSEADIDIRNILKAEKAISVENIRSVLRAMDRPKAPD